LIFKKEHYFFLWFR